MVIVKQELDEIMPPKASEPSGLNTSPAKKERRMCSYPLEYRAALTTRCKLLA